jgi:MFS family permease
LSSSQLPAYETPDPERAASSSPTEAQLESESPVSETARDPYAAWRYPNYRYYLVGSFLAALGGQLQATTIAWEMAKRAPDARGASWILGLISLVQGLPVLLLALPAGQLADRLNRRKIVMCGLAFLIPGSLLLAYLSHVKAPITSIYWCVFFIAVAGAMSRPAQSALLPQLVPMEALANAVTWSSTRWQIAAVLGPALFGPVLWLVKVPLWVYVLDAICLFCFFVCLLFLRPNEGERVGGKLTWDALFNWDDLVAGARFVFRTRLILATLTLDLFAVLLGGAIALLPVYAEFILKVGASELGWLRAAPSVGAVCMALSLAYLPPMRHAGRAMLWAVATFGLATIVFGLSTNYWLSLAALAVTGAVDNVSVVVRHTLVQLLTPDSMRGRVSAVNSVFIGASNELGGFESGAVAARFGPIVSVVSGGIGTIIVVIATAMKWPEVGRLGRLDQVTAEDENWSRPQ